MEARPGGEEGDRSALMGDSMAIGMDSIFFGDLSSGIRGLGLAWE